MRSFIFVFGRGIRDVISTPATQTNERRGNCIDTDGLPVKLTHLLEYKTIIYGLYERT